MRSSGNRKAAVRGRKVAARNKVRHKRSARGNGLNAIPRGGRKKTLVQALVPLLRGRTMSVIKMSGAVQKAGYRTKSPNFRTIVNAAMVNNRDLFKRVSRGQYTAK